MTQVQCKIVKLHGKNQTLALYCYLEPRICRAFISSSKHNDIESAFFPTFKFDYVALDFGNISKHLKW